MVRGYPKTGIYSCQDAKNAKSGNLISLRPLRLCGRYSEFWLRLCRARFYRLLFYVFASPHAFRITPAMLRPRIATIFFPVSALPDWGNRNNHGRY